MKSRKFSNLHKSINELLSKYHPEIKNSGEAYFLIAYQFIFSFIFSGYTIYLLCVGKVRLSTNPDLYMGILGLYFILAMIRLRMIRKKEVDRQIEKKVQPEKKIGDDSISNDADKDNAIFKLENETIAQIHNKCNGKQWEDISIESFINLLNSSGDNQSLTIKKDETNRTKYVFKIMASYIKDKNRRKIWIENIMKNIFNNVDFMRATLRTDKLSSGYSSIDAKFQEFFNDL